MDPTETMLPGLWKVCHKSFQTDDLRWTSSLVVADTKEEAVEKFNALAVQRLNYPYMWNKVIDKDVRPAEVIV